MEILSHHFVPSNFVTQNLKELAAVAGLRVYFLQSSSDVAVFSWIFAGNSVSNSGMFSLLLSRAYTESRPSLPCIILPASGLRAHKKLGGDTARTADPTDPRDIPYLHKKLSIYSWGKKNQGKDFQSDGIYLPKSMLQVPEPCFPGDC